MVGPFNECTFNLLETKTTIVGNIVRKSIRRFEMVTRQLGGLSDAYHSATT
jgi:hypothetical protein